MTITPLSSRGARGRGGGYPDLSGPTTKKNYVCIS